MNEEQHKMIENTVWKIQEIFKTERIFDDCVLCGNEMCDVFLGYGKNHYRQCFNPKCLHKEWTN